MVGQTISHYRITAKLGEGGMGAVYRAEDVKLQREVALKFLPGDLAADPDARKRLVKEARAASRLNHPNIGVIYEVNDEGDLPFIAMELVKGESLKQILQRGALRPEQLLGIVRQIADGLHEAHQAGVLHRDIKPANVMVDSSGRAKILDFGIAVLTERQRDAGETAENFVTRTATQASTAGTVPYMAPEQLRGESPDTRTDIFAFGVLLYECLSGRLPFRGDTAIDTLHAILHETPATLRRIAPSVPPAWEQLTDRCLAKAPSQRVQSMSEVLQLLDRIEAAPAESEEKSLAVLYFENLSGNKEDEYFRDGITEDVITDLSKIKELRVFPRSAVLAYRDKPVTAPQVGQQLNAAYVLEGSLRRAGNRLRLTAQLIETRSGHSVWAERYDRQMEDVFAIQDELAQNIARALQVMLTEREKRAIQKAPTADVRAYDYYLRGRQFFYQFRKKGFEFARQMFNRAIQIDPRYARAYAGIADCCSFLYTYWHATEIYLKDADEFSRKALELDAELAEAHASRGMALSLNKRFEEAAKHFETAIQLNPRLYEAYYFYARARFSEGKLEEAARLFEKSSEVNPDDYQSLGLVTSVYNGLGRPQDAERARRKSLEVIERQLEMHPDDARALYLGAGALAQLGQRERALEWCKRALAIDPEDTGILYNVACAYANLGLIDEALKCLENAVDFGFGHKAWIEHDTDLDPLRSRPRFQAVLARL
ncbi:MAG TPA: protein kinase [Candidatus Xenobia bacterium]|nr:protein kinase [Candidatus Xenobia bacterium]